MQSVSKWSVAAVVVLLAVLAPATLAQKGKGDKTGIARSAVRPDVVNISGKLLRIKDGPCSKTTGRSQAGTHLFVENREGREINLHLGPSAVVSHMVEGLKTGDHVTARAFRTDQMGTDEYVAVSFRAHGEMRTLRDDTLRPVWAGRPLAAYGRRGRTRIRRDEYRWNRSRRRRYYTGCPRRRGRRGWQRGACRRRGRCYRGHRGRGYGRSRGRGYGGYRGRGRGYGGGRGCRRW